MTTLLTSATPGQAAEGWIDLTIPAGYVTGTNLTVNLDIQALATPCRVMVAGMTFNGGTWTSATTALDGLSNTSSGYVATLGLGLTARPFLPATETAMTKLVSRTRSTVSLTVSGTNRNSAGYSILYGGLTPYTTVSGGGVMVDASNSPFYPGSQGPTGSSIMFQPLGPSPFGFYDMIDLMGGGTGLSAGPTAGGTSLAAGTSLSIAICTKSGTANLYGITVDCGGGGIVTVPITNMKVPNFNLGTISGDHNGSPTAVSTTGTGGVTIIGGSTVWVTANTPPPPNIPRTQGYIASIQQPPAATPSGPPSWVTAYTAPSGKVPDIVLDFENGQYWGASQVLSSIDSAVIQNGLWGSWSDSVITPGFGVLVVGFLPANQGQITAGITPASYGASGGFTGLVRMKSNGSPPINDPSFDTDPQVTVAMFDSTVVSIQETILRVLGTTTTPIQSLLTMTDYSESPTAISQTENVGHTYTQTAWNVNNASLALAGSNEGAAIQTATISTWPAGPPTLLGFSGTNRAGVSQPCYIATLVFWTLQPNTDLPAISEL